MSFYNRDFHADVFSSLPGLVIKLGREEADHCNHDEWNQRYNSCLECANTFGIWMYYGNSVTASAEECGLTAEPSASGFTGAPAPVTSTNAPAPGTTTVPPAQVSTTQAPVEEPATSTEGGAAPAPEESAVESAAETPGYPVPGVSTTLASSVAPSVVPSASQPAGNTTVPVPSDVPAGAAGVGASVAMVGAAAVFALAL